MEPTRDLERLPFERMARAYDGHPIGIAVEVVVMGSLSCLRSTGSIMTAFSPGWSRGSRIDGCSGSSGGCSRPKW